LPRPVVELEGYSVMPGEVYLFEEDHPSFFFDVFAEAVIQGTAGLLITREFPERLKAQYDLQKGNVIWLTTVVGRECLEPTQMNLILRRMVQFAKDNSPSIVMLDGVEYLINQNGFDAVIGFLNQLRDQIIIRNAVLGISIDPDTFETRELALLERNMQVVRQDRQRGPILSLESGVIKVRKGPAQKGL